MTQTANTIAPANWLPQTVSFAQFRQIMIDRGILGRCEACRQKHKGWTLMSKSADGKMIEFNLRITSADMLNGESFDLLATVCRHCGNTRLYHKRTLFAAINGLLGAE